MNPRDLSVAELYGPPINPKWAARRLAKAAIRGVFEPEALHAYTDAAGAELYWRIRARLANGDKWIRPMRREGIDYALGEPAFSSGKPLYRVHELAKQSGSVWYVEGESCADALAKLGVLTTTAGSASSDEAADFSPLAKRTVTIWPDNDQAGIDHGERVTQQLAARGCSIEMINAKALGLPEHGDCVDWLRAHPAATGADLATLPRIKRASISTPAIEVATQWPEPVPLPEGLLPVAQFDPGLLPDPLRAWIVDIAERAQCPIEFPAMGALVALGSILGRKLAIRLKQRDDWEEFANLWGVAIGSPGVLKSPALNEVLRPLRQLEAKSYEQHDLELSQWRADREAARVQRDAARDNARKAARKGSPFDPSSLVIPNEDEEPQPRRFVVNDSSHEALGVILAHNPNGVLAYRDELAGLLASLDREGMEGARQFYLSAYSGKEPYTFDRIIRGRTRIEACCVSMLGTSQPAVISRYIRDAVNSGGGDGLLSRFSLLVWPDLSGTWRDIDRWPESDSRSKVIALFERLNTLDPNTIGAEHPVGCVPFLRLDDDARGLFLEWRTDLEARLRDPKTTEHPAFIAHLAKYRKLVPALALLFHMAETGQGTVGEQCLMRALAWADLLESHARRAYGAIGQANVEGARALLSKLRAGKLSSPFVLREVYRNGWAGFSEPEQARRAADMLIEFDYLRAEEVPTGGRSKLQYHVNPGALA